MFLSRMWPTKFRDQLQGGIPRNYLAIDIETSGFKAGEDVVTEIGHVLVEDGNILDKASTILDWTNHPIVKPGWLRERLVKVGNAMADYSLDGINAYHITFDSMQERGLPPEQVFQQYISLIEKFKNSDFYIVGHNHTQFDENMLRDNIVGFQFGKDFDFGRNVFDTNAMERAIQFFEAEDPKALPAASETPRGYFYRMTFAKMRDRQKTLSKLRYCMDKYELHALCKDEQSCLHSAEFDAFVCHLLMQRWHKMDQDSHGPPPSALPPVEAPACERKVRSPLPSVLTRYRGQRNR